MVAARLNAGERLVSLSRAKIGLYDFKSEKQRKITAVGHT